MAAAVAEWLETIKPLMEGHNRFQFAVARNALGMIARDDAILPESLDAPLVSDIFSGRTSLATPGVLATLREAALDKLNADVPKYSALAAAHKKWTGET